MFKMFGMISSTSQNGGTAGGIRETRCPMCETAMLSTAGIVVRMAKRTYVGLPMKVCYRCKAMIFRDRKGGGWRLWYGDNLVE